MTARPIRRNAQTPDRNGKIFYTSTTSLSHISKMIGNVNPIEYKQPLELYKLMRKYARLKSLKRGYEILYGRELN